MLRLNASDNGEIGQLSWTHDADVPDGESFDKESQGERAGDR